MTTLLNVDRVNKQYKDSDFKLQDASLTISTNETVGLIGKNGSGDSDIMMTDTINPLKSKFKGFHKTFKQDDLGLSLSSFLLN